VVDVGACDAPPPHAAKTTAATIAPSVLVAARISNER